MSRKKEPEGPGPVPDQEQVERITLEQFKILAAKAEGNPKKVTALVKRLVLQTIDEVRETIAEGDSGQG